MMKFNKGQKIWFAEEKRPYTIRACNERYLICTKPFNLQPKTVMYTIVDLEEEIRGTDGYSIGPYDYYCINRINFDKRFKIYDRLLANFRALTVYRDSSL